ncbi:AraC family transcriptional regulator [Flavobacterium sp. ANB]|uniref:helix-turn-helix domain-containing protein n=1 Tax=unclassified Flavobacterium TaxID=196869 RepID=UPI0012B9C08C|nr:MULTISPECIES: AraC family transcriptional regulator [unclassified Flavobacterium]MBF4519462.1 AraC family transcriptional regulator [Flavobacterium sp. ANB]MTD72541.1 helix-turn-helix domain-containing protein [Flavobacterium sp. LC2016-13]
MAKIEKKETHDFYDTVKVMGSNFSEGHVGDEDFSLIISKILHPKERLPWTYTLHRSIFFVIGIVIDSYGSMRYEDVTVDIRPNMLFMNKPGDLQELTWEDVTETYGLLFSEDFIVKYAGISIYKTFPFLLFERHLPLHTSAEFQQELRTIILLIHQELKKDTPLKKKICANLLTRILLKIKQEFWAGYSVNNVESRNPDILNDFTQNLEYHYDQLLKGKVKQILHIKDYAEMQQLHENYLSTILKERTGKTAGQLIAEKTLSTAKILIQDSQYTMKEIAYMLGFSYTSYFSIFFKKHTGLTPLDYRKKSL